MTPTPIVFIADAMGSGKTTAARATLQLLQPSCILSFAVPGKAMVAGLLRHLEMPESYIYEALHGCAKENPIEGLGITPRRLMQTLGGDWGRGVLHENFWVDIMARRMRHLTNKNHYRAFLFDDCRYPNEVEMLRRRGGKVIRVVRPGAKVTSAHESEGQLRDIPVDFTITNNQTMTEMLGKTQEALRAIGVLGG